MTAKTSILAAGGSGSLEHNTARYAFIDALRGYAVLLVITCHSGGMFPELPYPLKRLTNFGWHGVQLFFLMSCVTLMLSWHGDEARGQISRSAFWMRRFFRIAPMYYAGALIYFLIEPPAGGFDPRQLLATLTFVNAWHPLLIPTVPDRWMVVPGGWSIGVEFSFYLVFPFIAAAVRSLRGAVVFLLLALIIGSGANVLVSDTLVRQYGEVAAGNFMYFWFPHQLPVFALGAILFFLLQNVWVSPQGWQASFLRRYGTVIVLGCALSCVVVANTAFPQRLPPSAPFVVPTLLVASLLFMAVVLVLGTSSESPFINRWIRSLGQVSFSAYLLHFAVLHKLPALLPRPFDLHATGWHAIVVWFGLWLATLLLTHGLSWITFTAIESPMIGVGKRVIRFMFGAAPGKRASGPISAGGNTRPSPAGGST